MTGGGEGAAGDAPTLLFPPALTTVSWQWQKPRRYSHQGDGCCKSVRVGIYL
ncbi:MAG: hypothetical protein KME26_02225 [Oscillatoria princeps RMCB-10]|nr:hypothetical protein [Oscillatoria princeps RMCB-10]